MSTCGCGRATTGTSVCTICKGTIERGFCGTDFKDLVKRTDGNWVCLACHQVYYAAIPAGNRKQDEEGRRGNKLKAALPTQVGQSPEERHPISPLSLGRPLNDFKKDSGQAGMTANNEEQKPQEGNEAMAAKPGRECRTEGCGKTAVKEHLCTGCYKRKHWLPFGRHQREAGNGKREAGSGKREGVATKSPDSGPRHDSDAAFDFTVYLRGLVRQEVKACLKEMFQ